MSALLQPLVPALLLLLSLRATSPATSIATSPATSPLHATSPGPEDNRAHSRDPDLVQVGGGSCPASFASRDTSCSSWLSYLCITFFLLPLPSQSAFGDRWTHGGWVAIVPGVGAVADA